jgi:FkbM family methyltransferase
MNNVITRDTLVSQLKQKQELGLMQIGTNTGGDSFNKICSELSPKQILLIEPHEELNEAIHRNYAGLNYTIINTAIVTDESKTCIEMYNTERTQHSSIIPLKTWDLQNLETKTVAAQTIKKILEEYKVNHVNLLYIDTEGFDNFIIDYIIKNNILNMFDNIIFEHWGFAPSDYEVPEKLHGTEGMQYIKQMTESKNFVYADFLSDEDRAGDNHIIYKK